METTQKVKIKKTGKEGIIVEKNLDKVKVIVRDGETRKLREIGEWFDITEVNRLWK
jgi:hypothetical protein